MEVSQSGRDRSKTARSAMPLRPNAAAWADSRRTPRSRLASSKARNRTPARRNIAAIIRSATVATRYKTRMGGLPAGASSRQDPYDHVPDLPAPVAFRRRQPDDRRAPREAQGAARSAEAGQGRG